MGGDEEGNYCTICGGVVPDKTEIRKIMIDGKETGVNQLDRILNDVAELNLRNEKKIQEELLKRTKVFNYIPKRKTDAYASAIMDEYRKMEKPSDKFHRP